MSTKYPGGYITKNYVAPTPAAAPGVWTLDQQLQAQKTGTWPLVQYNYIEDVFSTWLYTPAVSNDPITISNGIDLAGKGGMVWFKNRSVSQSHSLVDTVRGGTNLLTPNDTFAAYTASIITAFNSTGFTTGTSTFVTKAPDNYASWTFRKQPKFFDVVTYTGSGAGTQTIAHNLGSVPGCIITKLVSGGDTSGVGGWGVYHRSTGASQVLELNSTAAAATDNWYTTTPTATNFYVFGNDPHSNRAGGTYIAYLFAHDAGGFGLTGTDNVISCGSYTGNGSATGPVVTLGYEPQWLMVKASSIAGNWFIFDNMRGMAVGGVDANLKPNSSVAEANESYVDPTATGFNLTSASSAVNSSAETYIYIAIRRGPMKVPTDGTKVFYPLARTGNNTTTTITGFGFPPDLAWTNRRDGAEGFTSDKLRGPTKYLTSQTTAVEGTYSSGLITLNQDGVTIGTSNEWNAGTPIANWFFRRAPGFFDEVCYTGTGVDRTVNHNLAAVPELMIVKKRSSTSSLGWMVYAAPIVNAEINYLVLNLPNIVDSSSTVWNSTAPTSTVFSLGVSTNANDSAETYVAYLFATCPGVSKVGSYTGTGATQTIACGFAAGARFVLIKRVNGAIGNWYVWDTARGMVAGTDPSLQLNTTAAESNANWVYTATTGFQIVTSDASVNASGGSYIFLAIA